jgi:PAS domain-containing protein
VADAPADPSHAQKPLELILARNLITSISTPAFLVDREGNLLFYNEAAGALLGMSFEDAGRMGPEEWGTAFGPFDRDGEPIPFEELPLTIALREGRPAHSELRIRSVKGDVHEIEASALPLVGSEEGSASSGALAIFWPTGDRRPTKESR